jgi:uncharacterized protein YwgA
MPLTSNEVLEDKASNASESDKLVLYLLHKRPSRTTSVQKLGLLVHSALSGSVPAGFAPHFFGGFNEQIDTSLADLLDEGFVWANDSDEYALTPAGEKLVSDYLRDATSKKVKEITDKIVGRMTGLTDRDILSIAYELFPELTGKSLIKEKVARIRRVKNVELESHPH